MKGSTTAAAPNVCTASSSRKDAGFFGIDSTCDRQTCGVVVAKRGYNRQHHGNAHERHEENVCLPKGYKGPHVPVSLLSRLTGDARFCSLDSPFRGPNFFCFRREDAADRSVSRYPGSHRP